MQWIKDILERTAATYLEAFLGFLLAAQWVSPLDALSVVQTAAIAGIPAALAVLKAAIAKRFGSSDSASLIK